MKWRLLFHTVRYLKARQLAYQVYYRVRKPRLKELPVPVLRGELSSWPGEGFLEPSTQDGETFSFLGKTSRFDGNWNNPEFPKLWLYNLHYQDDLNVTGAEQREELCGSLVNSWIAGNPPPHGNGWEPYCLSLRIVNWVKFFSRLASGQVSAEWLNSLAQQADVLEQRLEFHILGNHLFANAKALVFVGCYLGGKQGDRWLHRGIKLLDKEIPEQFLADGAHYERSPMYQGILLWDLADLVALGKASGLHELKQRLGNWRERFEKGLRWLKAMSHPDGKISFFNDATFGIAPAVEDLEHNGTSLGLIASKDDKPPVVRGTLLQPSGYGIVDWPEGHRLLVDVAPVGPDYQPGHAHADTLSCELSLFGQRVLVNSGISQYGEGAERHRQRSTAAHNTVEVDGQNSSEVWAGFRVARRAKPLEVLLGHPSGEVELSGSHDGYKRLPGKVIHQRIWRGRAESLDVTDELLGDFEEAVAHWHFHPDIVVEATAESQFRVVLPEGQVVVFEVVGGVGRLESGVWHPGFGVSKKNLKLVIAFTGRKVTTRVCWSTN
ncbi:alginate lyase family protein [Marinobacter sp. SS13-12]|uniref:heparinase II/III family protein n=1 Tax=Marinobacter sp. SS13-12 TaxID=3050451 RepID=UPI002556392D|nr:alginate lyase family protein [Marinobacter sp. SS13-12]MDK8463857.1 alginate lyase family protein [Marinobacter sp. SS13-12]